MTTNEAGNILRKVIESYTEQYPERKEEVQEALEVFLKQTEMALQLGLSCQQSLNDCMACMSACKHATCRIS